MPSASCAVPAVYRPLLVSTLVQLLMSVNHGSGAAIPPLVYVGPGDTVARAVNVMRGYGLSQLPVAKGGVETVRPAGRR